MAPTSRQWTVLIMITWSSLPTTCLPSSQTSCKPCHSYLNNLCRCQQYGFVQAGTTHRYLNIDRCTGLLSHLPNFTNICYTDVLRIDIEGLRLLKLDKDAFSTVRYLNAMHYMPELRLANNTLEEIDDHAFDGMHGPLGILDLSFNRLKSIPSAVYGLTSLTELHIQNNLITNEGVRLDNMTLTNLIILDLSNNNLTSVPEGLCEGNAASPIHLRLHGNPIEKALSSYTLILARCWRLSQVTWPYNETTCDCATIVPLAMDISSEYMYKAIYPVNTGATGFLKWAPVVCDRNSLNAFIGRPISTISDMEVVDECLRKINNTADDYYVPYSPCSGSYSMYYSFLTVLLSMCFLFIC